MIIGDMNIHMKDSAANDTITVNNLPDSFNLMNSVLVLTHRLEKTIHVALTDTAYTGISQVKRGTLFSDHHFITFSVALRPNTANHKTNVTAYRKYKTIDHRMFADHISTSLRDTTLLELMLDDSAELYDKIVIYAPNAAAPLEVKTVSHKHTLSLSSSCPSSASAMVY